MNDFLLILQMKQGNEKAFDKFVRKYYAGILSYCRYHCMNQAEAEDLTQETFLRFMENIASYQHIGKAKNYLYVIAGNLCKNYAKKWKAESVEQEILERELVSDGGIHRKEKRMDVEQALGRLAPELREVDEYKKISEEYPIRPGDDSANLLHDSRVQGFSEIKDMINMGFCEFRDFNYYRIDSLSKEEVGQIYENRGKSLEKWLNSEDADGLFDENEKAFLIEQYREMKAPLYYEDYDGWKSALSYAQTIIMLIMLVSAFLVSGIFSNEFSWKSDSIFFSTKYGRDRGTRAKIMAGFIVVSVIYFIVISLYSLVVLGCLGSQGGNVMIQTGFWHWKSFYNITYMQLYLLTVVAGYIGTVFCLFLSMLVSAKTHTAVVAVTIPFAILFLPLFVSNFDFLSGILGVFPDRLLQINEIINTFDLYHIGGKIVGSIPIMLVIYPILSILMVPLMYHVYHKTEIK